MGQMGSEVGKGSFHNGVTDFELFTNSNVYKDRGKGAFKERIRVFLQVLDIKR